MRKFYLLCLACIAFFGCEKNDPTETPVPDFEITLTNITGSSVEMKIVPKSATATYFFDIVSEENMTAYHNSNPATYVTNLIADQNMWGDLTQAEFIASLLSTGPEEYLGSSLSPNTKYIAFAMGLDANGKITTPVATETFTTENIVSNNTFQVEFSNHTIDGVDVTITPSNNDDRYYSIIMPKVFCDQKTDKELLDFIFAENSFLMEYFAVSGISTYENENVWDTNTGYYFIVFGYDSGIATTKMNKFEFRTLNSDSDPANCTFTITIPEDKIKIYTASASVAPSDKTVMYLWDLIDEEYYTLYKNRMDDYVKEYAGQMMNNLYKMFERDDSSNTFSKMLNASTTYRVWAACIDEYGNPASPVALSAPFTTKAHAPSQVTAEMVYDKFYDGEALFAMDPEKYPASNRQYAYVPVTTELGEGDASPKLWYCNVFNEDLTDPTDPTDLQIYETMVNGGGGLWCMVGKPFLVEWDKPVTFLAVALDDNENFNVFRAVHTFSKAGVSDPSTLVTPENIPSMSSLLTTQAHRNTAVIRSYKPVQKHPGMHKK